MVNYRRFIPATILILALLFVRSVILDNQSIACSDYWGEINPDLSYPLFKDELCLRIENYRPKNFDFHVLVERVWLNYTEIPIPDDIWIAPRETKRLTVSPATDYKSHKNIVVKIWYRFDFSESIRCQEEKVVIHLNLLN